MRGRSSGRPFLLAGGGWVVVAGVSGGEWGGGWRVEAGAAERGFRLNFAGAKTNRRLFRAGASLPTARGHESSEGRLQRAIIEKSGGYFCVGARQNANESLYTTSCGRRARGGCLREGP